MTNGTARQDGRRQRAERSQQAVVEALLDLYRAGNLHPSAQEIAARSGVSTRTVFRLFDDMEALAALAMQRQWARVGHLFASPEGSGDREQRIAALVVQRLTLFAETAPLARVGQLRAPFSLAVRHGVEWRDRTLRDQLRRQFAAEIEASSPRDRETLIDALDTATSVETLLLLATRGRSPAEMARILTLTPRGATDENAARRVLCQFTVRAPSVCSLSPRTVRYR
jgi:AcrR family transcriptional regulator